MLRYLSSHSKKCKPSNQSWHLSRSPPETPLSLSRVQRERSCAVSQTTTGASSPRPLWIHSKFENLKIISISFFDNDVCEVYFLLKASVFLLVASKEELSFWKWTEFSDVKIYGVKKFSEWHHVTEYNSGVYNVLCVLWCMTL